MKLLHIKGGPFTHFRGKCFLVYHLGFLRNYFPTKKLSQEGERTVRSVEYPTNQSHCLCLYVESRVEQHKQNSIHPHCIGHQHREIWLEASEIIIFFFFVSIKPILKENSCCCCSPPTPTVLLTYGVGPCLLHWCCLINILQLVTGDTFSNKD